MFDLTGFQRDLLYLLTGFEKATGEELKEAAEEYYEREIHHGRLYPNLDTLADKGLVDKTAKDRRTNNYRLTRRGRRILEDRREWETKQSPEFWS